MVQLELVVWVVPRREGIRRTGRERPMDEKNVVSRKEGCFGCISVVAIAHDMKNCSLEIDHKVVKAIPLFSTRYMVMTELFLVN